MNLGNTIKVAVSYLLIGGMTCHSCWDEFSMISTLVYMVTHWIGPTELS